jgi:hypothetical protein
MFLTNPRLTWIAAYDEGPLLGLAETLEGRMFVFDLESDGPFGEQYRLYRPSGASALLWRWKHWLYEVCVSQDWSRRDGTPVPPSPARQRSAWQRRLERLYWRLPGLGRAPKGLMLDGRYRLTRLSDWNIGFVPACQDAC